ncbi:hypothetical protein C2857_001172 [Epichloe festucae Fl1]|uniref:DNA/RNA-binding protein Alba-like domain-containing protein n=1 Tax=Epichloe festucae (strain Fl1) TaxID=877507 RepID=A0A7S9KU75_EPIFF|nr:hypothetical protein C2857_001172 [Epichloe festucae Fl1]
MYIRIRPHKHCVSDSLVSPTQLPRPVLDEQPREMPPSTEAAPAPSSKKRKEPSDAQKPPKRSKPQPSSKPALIGPHEDIISQLQPKHNILAASVISSTQIRKRVTQITSHLGAESDLPAVVLLYARTAEVCKMITIAEQCKRLMKEQGKRWFQYNQMFEMPTRDRDVVEETVLDGQQGESSDDEFEVMASRFEKAVMPEPQKRVVRSMRVFLSVEVIRDLGAKNGITMQSSENVA